MASFIRKAKKTENYQDLIARLYDDHTIEYDQAGNPIPHNGLTRTCTLQVTDACNLRCTYCYQIAKNTHRMSFDIAKRYIDMLLEDDQENDYVNTKISQGLIVEFIGGEPLLEIDLIDQVTDYLYDRMLELDHPWLNKFMISICSNGVLYMDPRFQRYIEKNKYHLSFSISIDGNKELHDACRVFPDGSGSYDIAIQGVKHFREVHHGHMGSKMTIAPGNIDKVFVAAVNLINLGYEEIFLNCVYEDGWDAKYAYVLYQQLTQLADYMIDNDLFDKIYFSIFEDTNFCPMSPDENDNWCGGTGSMLSCDYKGDLYPCIRYMESSLGTDAPPLKIGNVYDGLLAKPEEKEIIKCMRCVTRRSQSTDECFYCPIASGCSWCFRAGTLIETIDGPVPIEDIKVGDRVLTQSGEYHSVVRNMMRTASEDETMVIRAAGAPETFTTAEHPFWTKKFIKYDSHTGHGIYEEPTWIPAKDINAKDRVMVNKRAIGDVHFNPDIAYVVGRWLGDGWRRDFVSHNGKTYSSYHICCGYHEIDELEMALDNAGLDYHKDHTLRTAQEYLIKSNTNNPNNAKLIDILSKCKKYAYGKCIPEEVFTWDRAALTALIDGYTDADGMRIKHVIRTSTVSPKLAYGIAEVYRILGYNPSYSLRYSNTDIIEGRKVKTRTAYDLRVNTDPQRMYYDIDEENHCMWITVNSVEKAGESYNVFNMTVEGDPSYYANGMLVHNCSAYNYQTFGTVDKRATFICIMHKARALANAYYWNKGFRKYAPFFRFKNYVPDDWALEIISQDELNMLRELESFTDADLQDVANYIAPSDTQVYADYQKTCLTSKEPIITNLAHMTTVQHDVVDVNGNVETTIEKH